MTARSNTPPSKQRVAVVWDRSRQGYVIAAGPEQSEVRLDGERQSRMFINEELVNLLERVRSKRIQ